MELLIVSLLIGLIASLASATPVGLSPRGQTSTGYTSDYQGISYIISPQLNWSVTPSLQPFMTLQGESSPRAKQRDYFLQTDGSVIATDRAGHFGPERNGSIPFVVDPASNGTVALDFTSHGPPGSCPVGNSACNLTFQADGNLVLTRHGKVAWASGTNGKGVELDFGAWGWGIYVLQISNDGLTDSFAWTSDRPWTSGF